MFQFKSIILYSNEDHLRKREGYSERILPLEKNKQRKRVGALAGTAVAPLLSEVQDF